MKILVVEDDALFAAAVAATLQDAGYAVLGPVKSAAEAKKIFHVSQPDLVLMNIQLKGDETGVDLARELTSRSGKIAVFISGQREAAVAARDFALGAVVKPHNFAALPRAIEFFAAMKRGIPTGHPPYGVEVYA